MAFALNFRNSPLPNPGSDYDPQYVRQLIRVLEIYFSQSDAWNLQLYQALTGVTGNNIVLPHIAASDSTDQIATGNNIPTVVKWDTLDSGFGWTLNPPGSATSTFAGVYKITYSLQFINTDNAIHYVTVWLKVNNNDIPNSATRFLVPSRKSATPGEEGFVCAYSEITFEVAVGDEIELYWATNKAGNPTTPTTGVYMLHEPAQTTPFACPAVPSAVGSITFVSAIP